MPLFFDLPRELRDLIYTAIITWENPRPTRESTWSVHDWNPLWESQTGGVNDSTCFFSSESAPTTCANVLAASRQCNKEMCQAIDCAKRKRLLLARLDCMVTSEKMHLFTWLSIPIVHNTARPATAKPKSKKASSWAPRVPGVARLLAAQQREKGEEVGAGITTCIEELQVDIRLFADDTAQQGQRSSDQTSWAVCAALKSICEPNFTQNPHDVTIDTLTLNVVSAAQASLNTAPKRDSAQMDVAEEEAHVVARELVDVWNKLWSSDNGQARCYGNLLRRIKRVRVCVDGVLVRERELRLELERGQAERRRIAMRVGW
jgi:hypothetical protein